jgi:hypothetical protein
MRKRKQMRSENNKWVVTMIYMVKEKWTPERPKCIEHRKTYRSHHMKNSRETNRKKKGLQNIFPPQTNR